MENFTRGGDRGGNRGSFRNGGGKGGFKGGFRGGWKGGSGGDRGGDRDSRPMTMHPATCSACQKPCEVPFRPTGEKPVYCRDCFAGRAALGGERSSRKDFRGEEKSFSPKPFAQNNPASNINNKANDDLRKQIDSMNVKLDKLTNTIQNLAEKMNKGSESKVVEVEAPVSTTSKIEEKMIAKPKVKKVAKKIGKK